MQTISYLLDKVQTQKKKICEHLNYTFLHVNLKIYDKLMTNLNLKDGVRKQKNPVTAISDWRLQLNPQSNVQ